MSLGTCIHRISHALLAVLIGLCALADVAVAQKPDSAALRGAIQRFGMDSIGFQRLFQTRPVSPDTTPSTSIEGVADRITELRVYLSDRSGLVVGEIAVAGGSRLDTLTFSLEQGPVRFVDNGRAPDRKRGDGVYSAQFRMNADSTWQAIRGALEPASKALLSPDKQLVRRGPRDIVPASAALESMRKSHPERFKAITDSASRLAPLTRARTASEAAKLARIDVRSTPFFTLPGPQLPGPRIPFRRVFGLPFLELFPLPFPVSVDIPRSLMVTNVGVVENDERTYDICTSAGTPAGPWTFGHLMRELSHGTGMSPEDFTMHWLSSWLIPQEANGFIANEPTRAAGMQARIIDSWQRASNGPLSVDSFPARLLAIVNRPDLADKIGYGVAGSAGEGRLVFGLLERSSGGCGELPFTVIFEYGIRGGSCPAVKSWHQGWKNLDAHPLGSAAYNAALEQITRAFTDHGSNPSQSPNQSSLNQLRTNEIALASPWQLREFRLQSNGAVSPGLLDMVTVKQTPADQFNGSAQVSAYIRQFESSILAGNHVVPDRFPSILDPFLGATTNVPFPPDQVFWNAPGLTSPPLTDPPEARRIFSLGTCNACHGGETATFFTHIGSVGNRAPGSEAQLSQFLTGFTMNPVPVFGGTHVYADLQERQNKMSDILTSSCFGLLGVRRIPFVH